MFIYLLLNMAKNEIIGCKGREECKKKNCKNLDCILNILNKQNEALVTKKDKKDKKKRKDK